jgi:hypothetical protein
MALGLLYSSMLPACEVGSIFQPETEGARPVARRETAVGDIVEWAFAKE